jgi:SAM-dependent methyltransferase
MVADSTRYDMVHAPDESYYAKQYWSYISPLLQNLPCDAHCLDLGCSQGRFSLKVAEYFREGSVIACDLSASAIASAKKNAEIRQLTNVSFNHQSIADQLSSLRHEGDFELLMMTEVTFCYPEWQSHLPKMISMLRPGGLLVMSFRSQYFDALCLVRSRNWGAVDMVMGKRRGQLFPPSPLEFSWQTSSEIRSMFEESGLELLVLQGVGVCSGIPGDPHDCIARPSLLDSVERSYLMKLEVEFGKMIPDAGRYILAIGKKRTVNNPSIPPSLDHGQKEA